MFAIFHFLPLPRQLPLKIHRAYKNLCYVPTLLPPNLFPFRILASFTSYRHATPHRYITNFPVKGFSLLCYPAAPLFPFRNLFCTFPLATVAAIRLLLDGIDYNSLLFRFYAATKLRLKQNKVIHFVTAYCHHHHHHHNRSCGDCFPRDDVCRPRVLHLLVRGNDTQT